MTTLVEQRYTLIKRILHISAERYFRYKIRMLTAVIIDDDPESTLLLTQYLRNMVSTPVKITGKADNLEQGIELIDACKPDIVFIDTHLQQETGLEIFSRYATPLFRTIVITANERHAMEAVKRNVTGFLLKPVQHEELRDLLRKVAVRIEQEHHQEQVLDKAQQLASAEMPGRNVIFQVEDGFLMENTRNIEYCFASRSYSVIVTHLGKELTITRNLKKLHEMLPGEQFYRTHKSYLVNIFYIRRFVNARESYVVMKSGKKIPVSVRKSSIIFSDIKKMLTN